MLYASTIAQLLAAGRDKAAAIEAPGRRAMTHAQLRAHVDATVDALNARGIGRNHRVAIVLPNGPELAGAFIAVAAGATAAPLDPACTREEFDVYLEELRAAALLVERGSTSEAVAAARALGIAVLEVDVEPDAPAGAFTLAEAHRDADAEDKRGAGPAPDAAGDARAGDKRAAEAGTGAADHGDQLIFTLAASGDIALVLPGSDTKPDPGTAPLSQTDICTAARNVIERLQLTAEDRCLNVMPLFHIDSLVASVLAAVGSGGAAFCAPGFDAADFFGRLDEARPTWFTAEPSMYEAILALAGEHAENIEGAPLRFLGFARGALPSSVVAQAEEVFGVPLVAAGTVTETATATNEP